MTASPTPVVLITGVCANAMAAATIGQQWDLPGAVVVHHRIDVEGQQLHRLVSDVSGALEREVIDLAHACVGCAIREDIIPTLRRLADVGRWQSIVVHLPVAAEARQVCRVLEAERVVDIKVTAIVTALDGTDLVSTLTGDALLCEEGRHTAEEDRRGTAETACALIEYADVVSVHGAAPPEGLGLVRALARPGAVLVGDAGLQPTSVLIDGVHHHDEAESWVSEMRIAPLPRLVSESVWQLDLRSDRPLHPARLHDRLGTIGGGAHRSRGCFWLATRPGTVCAWDGAGGQVSVGAVASWGHQAPMSRLVVTGLDALTSPAERAAIEAAFRECLLTEAELAERGPYWDVASDGFEPWLGTIRIAA
jgi:G3E family GTPase